MNEVIVSIRGIPVYVGTLPSGDLKIWHPHNDAVRLVVEPICRKRGYWRTGYNNWIVYRWFATAVLNELCQQEAENHG